MNKAREQKKVILCVDDEKIVLNSLQSMLARNFGKRFILEFAESAGEAFEIIEELELARQELYIVITDWLMPEMRGDELLRKIKSKYPNLRTIMLSGQVDREVVKDARNNAWLDHLITKPWEERDLVKYITQE